MVLATVERVVARRTRGRPPRSMVTVDVTDGTGQLPVTFFNQPWRERQLRAGHRGRVLRQGSTSTGARRQMTNPVVDLIGDQTGRIVPVYPQSEKAGLTTWELGDWVAEALRRAAARGFADPLPDWVLDRFDLIDRGRALRRHPRARVDGRRAGGPPRLVFDELLRVQLALVQRKRPLERTAQGIRHVDRRRRSCDASTAALPFPLTGAQERGHRRDRRRPRRAPPDAPAAAGRRRAGKTVVAVGRAARRRAGRAPGRVHGADRGAGRAARLGRPGAARRRSSVPDDGATLFGDRPRARRAAHQPHDRRRARRAPRRPGRRRRSTSLIGTHALIQEGVDVPVARRGGHRRAAPLRRRAAGRAARQGGGRRGARRAGHDGHADPAHRGHDRLRRPRRDRARRAARRAPGHRHHRWARGPRRDEADGVGRTCGARWRPGARPTWCAR